MSKIMSAKEICEMALGAINAFPTSDSAASPEQLRRAMRWLDTIMAQHSGAGRLFFQIPATLQMAITNGTASYNLYTTLGANLPIDRIQFPVGAWLSDSALRRYPIEISTLEEFEAKSATDTGRPEFIHIDRLPTTPILRIKPVPPESDPETWTLNLVVQTYAPNVAPGGVTGTLPSASALTGYRQAWQRFLIAQLAHDLGTGPIFKIAESSLNRFASMANDAKAELEAHENDEHDTEPPVCADAWGH